MRRVLMVGLIFLLLLSLGESQGKIIIVDDDGGSWADYSSIRDACDNATTNDIIRIFSGEYHEKFIINRSLSLIGNVSNETVIAFYQYSNRTIDINASNVLLSNLMIDGIKTGNQMAIYVRYQNNISIENCTFTNTSRGFVCQNTSNINFYDCSFNSHETTLINFYSSNNITIKRCYFNTSKGWYSVGLTNICQFIRISNCIFDGEGIGIEGVGKTVNCVVVDCIFNSHSGFGYWNGENISVKGCEFSGIHGAGLYRGNSVIENCVITGARSNSSFEGAIRLGRENNQVLNCTFDNNSINDIVILDDYLGISSNNIIAYNRFFDSRGGIQIDGPNTTIHHNWFYHPNSTATLIRGDSKGIFDDGSEGNWWSDYSGDDNNLDYIGDTSFNNDNFPLLTSPPSQTRSTFYNLKLNAYPDESLEEADILFIGEIEIDNNVSDHFVSVYILVDNEFYDQFFYHLNESSNQISFTLKFNDGYHNVTLRIAPDIDVDITVRIHVVKKRSSDSAASIPNIGYVLLAVTTVFLATYRRRSF